MRANNIAVAKTLVGLIAAEAMLVVHGEDSQAKRQPHTHQENARSISADPQEVTTIAASNPGATVPVRGRAVIMSSARGKLIV